jgi:hypothetical protein
VAIESRQLERARVGLAPRVEGRVERHRACRQGAGLVAAQDVDRAEILDRGQVLDDHLDARHLHRATRQRDRGDHRQKFGRQADRERDREQQRLERIAPRADADHQDEQHQKEHGLNDQRAEMARAALELGLLGPLRDLGHDLEERGRSAGRDHHRGRGPAHDRGAEKHELRAVRAQALERRAVRCFLGRQRLAGHRGLLHVEIAAFQQARIRGHQIAGRQSHDVTRDQLPPRDLAQAAVAQRRGCRRDAGLKLAHRALRAQRLKQVEHGAERHDRGDDRRVEPLSQQRRGEARQQQNHRERAQRRAHEREQLLVQTGCRVLVGSALREPAPCFCRR